MKKAAWPGNIVLERGEASLIQRSIVDVSQVSVIQKNQLMLSVFSRQKRILLQGFPLQKRRKEQKSHLSAESERQLNPSFYLSELTGGEASHC